ncbi:hypothetical protein BJQ94_02865 [Cryobacterium sp. SO2]|uniref:hypothetical protein n=1 Tax=Cryobacterium sp. SO2 TaxID=1897060 RepID=UPI00223DE4BD|nr:hypothetical protein [Cryobacterium sp. SO2]WEO77999.1 hypothetical protein BJQ94_02865 [Cryobacterium sp. SO2]
MGFRRRTRRLRRWYRRHEQSNWMLAARWLLIAVAAGVVAVIAIQAITVQNLTVVP